jgi:hypothetical protein
MEVRRGEKVAFTNCTVTVNNIASLSDLPNVTDGLSAATLKGKFDQTGTDLKTFLNSTLLSELANTGSGTSATENIGGRSVPAVTGSTIISAGTLYSQLVAIQGKIGSFVTGTGFMPTSGGTFTGEVYFPDGTSALPSISNAGDTNTGIYFPAENEIGFSLNASERVNFKIGEYTFNGVNTTGQFPKITLQNTYQGSWIPTDVIGKLDFYISDASGTGARTVASISSENSATSVTTTADLVFKTSINDTTETEKMRLLSSGNLGLNTTTAGAKLHVNGDVLVSSASSKFVTRFSTTNVTPDYQFFGTDSGSAILAGRFSADASSSRIYFAKSRNATAGSHTVVQSGDQLGGISFGGSDGTNISEGVRISAEVDGTPGANDMPGRLVFLTTADGSATPTERMRIASTGSVSITAPTTTASAANMFIPVTVSGTVTGEIQRSTSSRKYKQNIHDYDKGIEYLKLLRPVYYNGINDGEKQFAGLIAEEVHDINLPEFVQYNENNEPDSLAYTHMISLLIKSIQEQQATIESLTARLELLESKVV